MSRFLLIVGPSGSGKTSVCDMMKPYGKTQIASFTNRQPRYAGEDSHTFVDSYQEWKMNHPNDDIVAITLFDGNYYWATASQVEENDLFVIDMAGIKYFQAHYKGSKDIRIVFIKVSIIERFKRMKQRGDSTWSVIRRIIGDLYRFRGAPQKADFIVRNDNIWRCRDEVLNYFNSEGVVIIPHVFANNIIENIWNDRYRKNGETYDESLHRVAKVVASAETESKREYWEGAYYDLMARGLFFPAGRTMSNAGIGDKLTLNNCFVAPMIGDSMDSIFDSVKLGALTHKAGGGIGYSFSLISPRGKHTHNDAIASGPVSFMDVFDAQTATIQQGSRRK